MNKLPLIPIDKANHFIYGSIIYTLGNVLFTPLLSIIIVLIIGALKELYDYHTKTGTPDYKDFLWTVFGGLVIFINNIL
jgi:hypothetical protein